MIKNIFTKNKTWCVLMFSFFLLLKINQGYSQGTAELRKKLEIRDKFNLAMGFFNRKSYAISIPYFIETLKQDSSHFFARYYLSMAFFRNGKTDEAIREMENLIRIDGLNRDVEMKINFFSQQKFLDQKKMDFLRYVQIRDYPNLEAAKASWGSSLNPFNLLNKKGYEISTPIHLKVTENNELLALDFSLKLFIVLDGDGVFLGNRYEVVDFPSSHDPLGGPWAFAESGEKIWITDFLKDNIKEIGIDGKVKKVIGVKGIGETNFLGVKGITTDENGNFYLADSGNARIQFRNQNGEWLKNIGSRGSHEDQLLNPIDVAYDTEHRELFVLDKGNKKIARFSAEGEFLSVLPGTEALDDPRKIILDSPAVPDNLYILDRTSLYRYRLEPKRMETFELNRDPSLPADFSSFALGEDGYLYLGNPLRKKIEVYAPVEKTYVNLPVMAGAINTGKFPLVRAEVTVKDLSGRPVKFLQSRNFSLYENKVALPFNLIPPPVNRRIVLLVEKSSATQQRSHAVRTFMEGLFNQLTEKEGVKVITYNQEGATDQTPYSTFKLAAIERTLQNDYTPGFAADQALLGAVNDTKEFGYKYGIVMLVFSPYEMVNFQKKYSEVIQTVKNNDVPVYVFYAGRIDSIKENNFYYLRNLVSQTGGRFYVYDEQALPRFENDFNNYNSGVYGLEYLTVTDPRNRGVFRRVSVEVRYKNSQGKDDLAGYPIP